MSGITIIPAIDIIEGKCVRLTQGDYNTRKIYNEKPLEVAQAFEDAGIERLHLVDLDGAKAGKVTNWKVLEQLTAKTHMAIDFGGGVKTLDDARIIFNSGAKWVTLGSIAVKDKTITSQMLSIFGADNFFFGADVKNEKLAIHGWLEETEVDVNDFITEYSALGVQQFFCTDISKDGMMQGPATELYNTILQNHETVQLTASGGVRHMADVESLAAMGMHGVIIGKAIYEGTISIPELTRFIHQ